MQIEPAMDQYERAGSLPLVTESATVTAVEPLDENRVDAVVATLTAMLADAGVPATGLVTGHAVDWAGVRDALPDRRAGAVAVLRERYERAYPSLVRIRLRPETPVDFVPGQYVGVRYGETPRAYSLACSPTADELELCVSRVPDGRLSTQLCSSLTVGAELTLRGPAGEFLLGELSERDLVFVATGTGVAPLRSMIAYTFETGRNVHAGSHRDIWLFLGARWRDDLPYHQHFETLAKRHDRFHYVPTLSREQLLSAWAGETAYVQDVLAGYLDRDTDRLPPATDATQPTAIDARIDPTRAEFYGCGSNAMVAALATVARENGVPDRHIHTEGYG